MVKKLPIELITDAPLTTEACEQFLLRLFDDDLPHLGDVFLPDDNFYSSGTSTYQANYMCASLCQWLGIKAGYIGLVLEGQPTTAPDGSRHTIYVEQAVLRDEFVLGATLAYALTRYLVEERKQIRLPHHEQQDMLLATASLLFGLGLVVSNGLAPTYGWLGRLTKQLRKQPALLGSYGLSPYVHDITLNLQVHQVTEQQYAPLLTPWNRQRLGLRRARQTSQAVRAAQHRTTLANTKFIGIVWVIGLLAGVYIFTQLQRVKPLSPAKQAAADQVQLLTELSHLCRDSVNYDRQYADLSDFNTIRALNAEDVRCRSLENQLSSAQTTYENTR